MLPALQSGDLQPLRSRSFSISMCSSTTMTNNVSTGLSVMELDHDNNEDEENQAGSDAVLVQLKEKIHRRRQNKILQQAESALLQQQSCCKPRNSEQQQNASRIKQGQGQPEDPCLVCGDISSGRHYGQTTCEGCKSFFKRVIRRKNEYVCRNNRRCEINIQLRNHCQACRFHKCLRIGMRKEVHNSRGQPCKNESTSLISNREDPFISALTTNIEDHLMSSYTDSKDGTSNQMHRQRSNDDQNWDLRLVPGSKFSIKSVLDMLLRAENAAPIMFMENFVDQSMRILYSIIEWSKMMTLGDEISTADKLLLLGNCWHELFLVNYSLCGLATRLYCLGSSSRPAFINVQSQLLAINRLPMDPLEYGCLKAIVYFDPDTPLLFNNSAVDRAREIVQNSMEQHVQHSPKESSSTASNVVQTSRFGRLLLRIPFLRTLTVHDILDVFFNKQTDSEPFVKVINELFHNSLQINHTPSLPTSSTEISLF